MNVLITGATGFLGKRLSQELLNEGHRLFVLVRNEQRATQYLDLFTPNEQNNISILLGDVSEEGLGISEESVRQLNQQIDAVYHLAAFLSFDDNQKTHTFKVNVEGTKHTLAFSHAIGCPRFLYVSTAYTLGDTLEGKEELYNPDRPFVNHYEESKCLAEHLVLSYQGKMDVVILRPSIIIGDSQTGQAETNFGMYGFLKGLSVLKRRVSRAKDWEAKQCRIVADVHETTNLVPVDYVSFVLTTALTHAEKNKIYNITNPAPPTQMLIIECMKEVLDFPNLETVPLDSEQQLTEQEKSFHHAMSVFKKYLNRSITFTSDNTRNLLKKVNKRELHLDKALLTHIMRGFQA
ncbi:SDR family oxidoreductase [Brevibacillus sp. SYSU BS000544]|uniref:SDR family oxidoreductase n=1 Tax=Brevibacillus sp. SYSU BS000544 TaxID=3416443 RepID=UPI003CE4DF6D